MCCLFGMIDYGRCLTAQQRARILSALAIESEARGTDAAGIAYNTAGRLHVCKRPGPAHKLHILLPADAKCVMGHTRMTTQGSEKRNYNNHPFLGQAGGLRFALAHNGVLQNDRELRRTQKLPSIKIQTDSYVAVQLIEKKGTLDFSSLQFMAEQVEGSFCFTVLDELGNWYLVKGDNPLCLCRFPKSKLYLYASTEGILSRALARIHLEEPEQVPVHWGDILRIDSGGDITQSSFVAKPYACEWYWPYAYTERQRAKCQPVPPECLTELNTAAAAFGHSPGYVGALLEEGFTPEDIEEILYSDTIWAY